jgi:hypothetical protein
LIFIKKYVIIFIESNGGNSMKYKVTIYPVWGDPQEYIVSTERGILFAIGAALEYANMMDRNDIAKIDCERVK